MLQKLFKSSLIKTSGIYTLTNIINSAIPFFLLPILTIYLTPADYGIVSMFGVMLGFFSPFIGLNVYTAISRKYFEKNRDLSTYISTSIYLIIVSTFLTVLLVLFFSESISKLLSFPKEYIILVVIAGFGNSIIRIVLTLWQVRERAIKYGVFQISQTVLNVTLTILLVVLFNYGWLGRISGQVIAIIVFSFIGIVIICKREHLTLKFSRSYAKDILTFGVPLIPHTIGVFLIATTDRVFITNMIGIHETGIYTVGYQIALIIEVLQDAFNKAWTPYLFKNLEYENTNRKVKIVRITYFYFVIITLIVILLSFIAPWIVRIFIGDAFKDAIVYIFWIGMGFAFNGMYKMVSGVIYYKRKTYILSVITFITALLNIGLNYTFIKINGTLGAAQATATSFLISFILTWIISSRVYPMPWNLIKYKKV